VEFAIFVVVSFAILIGALMAVGRWYPGSGADVVDWRPTRSHEDEVRLELEDIDQMLALQNESRRRKGRPEITEDQVRAEVEAEERERRARAERYRAEAAARSAAEREGDATARSAAGAEEKPTTRAEATDSHAAHQAEPETRDRR
jgi:hypothetical protein